VKGSGLLRLNLKRKDRGGSWERVPRRGSGEKLIHELVFKIIRGVNWLSDRGGTEAGTLRSTLRDRATVMTRLSQHGDEGKG